MILADSSIWISYFKQANTHFTSLLQQDVICCHPFVIGEVACGIPPNRTVFLSDLKLLDQVTVASVTEVLEFIESECLYGRGCGFVDLSLLRSVMVTKDTLLWTADKRLAALATEMQVLYTPPLY